MYDLTTLLAYLHVLEYFRMSLGQRQSSRMSSVVAGLLAAVKVGIARVWRLVRILMGNTELVDSLQI